MNDEPVAVRPTNTTPTPGAPRRGGLGLCRLRPHCGSGGGGWLRGGGNSWAAGAVKAALCRPREPPSANLDGVSPKVGPRQVAVFAGHPWHLESHKPTGGCVRSACSRGGGQSVGGLSDPSYPPEKTAPPSDPRAARERAPEPQAVLRRPSVSHFFRAWGSSRGARVRRASGERRAEFTASGVT